MYTQKSNKPIAGYHLLMLLSAVDSKFAPEEGKKIAEFLAEEFPFRLNLDDELEIIINLKPEQWKEHFTCHADCFYDDSTPKEREKFVEFAKSLIKADQTVHEYEHRMYKYLKQLWNK
mgnify:FL=1